MKGIFKLICATLALAGILAGVGIGASAAEDEIGFSYISDVDYPEGYVNGIENVAAYDENEATAPDVGEEIGGATTYTGAENGVDNTHTGDEICIETPDTGDEIGGKTIASDGENEASAPDVGEEIDGTGIGEANGGTSIGEVSGDAGIGEASGDGASIDTANGGEENIFAAIYGFASERSAEIFALLSFIGSLIIVICYKSGILPLLREGLGGMLGAVGKLKEGVAESERLSKETSEALSTRLGEAEYMIGGFSERVAAIEAACELTAKRSAETSDLKELITLEIDLLHDVFMTAAISPSLRSFVLKNTNIARPLTSS